MTMRTFGSIAELFEAVGQTLGVSSWREVTQDEVSVFAEVTKDTNPIHVDQAYAAETSFGTTIAHGLFTLSLGPAFNYALADFSALGEGLNYGYDKVRFPAPLPVRSRVRMQLTLLDVQEGADGVRVRLGQRFEREGHDRPVCVTEAVLFLATG
jgi:acyl dehydratase